MTSLPRKPFRPSSYSNTIGARYRAQLQKHPFALFGLPFIVTMVAGSFFLTPAAAIRYERHDKKVRRMTREEELDLGSNRRQVDMKEEYYVRHLPLSLFHSLGFLSKTKCHSSRETMIAIEHSQRWYCIDADQVTQNAAASGKRFGQLGAATCEKIAGRARWSFMNDH